MLKTPNTKSQRRIIVIFCFQFCNGALSIFKAAFSDGIPSFGNVYDNINHPYSVELKATYIILGKSTNVIVI